MTAAAGSPITSHYDVVVIGSGPGGGTTAAKLAETGRRVLLERGGCLPRERDNWDSKAVFGAGAALFRLLPSDFTAVQHPGADPATSALDVHCKAQDLDNLYVVDGAFMPFIGAVNPTLTIIANAIRVAAHIASRLTAS